MEPHFPLEIQVLGFFDVLGHFLMFSDDCVSPRERGAGQSTGQGGGSTTTSGRRNPGVNFPPP